MLFLQAFLRRLFGPEQAVTLTYLIREYSVLILAALLLVLGSIALVAFYRPERHSHDSYLLAEVSGIIPTGSDMGRVLVNVTLPDGTSLRLTTTSGLILGSIIDHACVERRVKTVSGGFRHQLVPFQNCQTN